MHDFQGREIFESVAEMVNPKHTVVMVHDMQNDFLHDDGIFKKAGESIDVSGFLGQPGGLCGGGSEPRGEGLADELHQPAQPGRLR